MENLRAGIIAATVANYAGREAVRPLEPQDFMPQRAVSELAQDDDEIAAAIKASFGIGAG